MDFNVSPEWARLYLTYYWLAFPYRHFASLRYLPLTVRKA
jgi:hypothetical protein